jgi:molybdate transport system regulatory protein
MRMGNTSVKSILKEEGAYKVTGKLWVEADTDRFFGTGRIELLQLIDETGSINKAAQKMNMSYKRAWEIVNAFNTHAKKPLVVKQAGGEKGGGSVITDEARLLIGYHQQLTQRFQAFLDNETQMLAAF